MMRRSPLILVVIAGVASMSPAQGAGKISLVFCAGPAIPAGPDYFSDYWSIGPAISAGVEYQFRSFLMFRGGLELADFPRHWPHSDMPPGYDISGGQRIILGPSLGLKAVVPSSDAFFGPYFIAGIGFHGQIIKGQRIFGPGYDQKASDKGEMGVSLFLGLGYESSLSKKVGIFLECRFVNWHDSYNDARFLPIVIGLSIR